MEPVNEDYVETEDSTETDPEPESIQKSKPKKGRPPLSALQKASLAKGRETSRRNQANT